MQEVGLDRFIKVEWLDKTVNLLQEEGECKTIRSNLDIYLKDEVKGSTTRRKAIDKLIGIWVNVPKEFNSLRAEAIKLAENINDNERLLLHWTMMISGYPIFRDMVEIIGTILDKRDDFSLNQVQREIYKLWGERSTIKYAVQKLLSSMVNWGVIQREGNGNYNKKDKIKIRSTPLKLFFLKGYMRAYQKDDINFTEVDNLEAAFPFELGYLLEDFLSYDDFIIRDIKDEGTRINLTIK